MACRKTTGNALFNQEHQIDRVAGKNGANTVIFERATLTISTSTWDPNLHVFSLTFVGVSYLVNSISWFKRQRTSEVDTKSLASKQGYSCSLHFESNIAKKLTGCRFAGVEHGRFWRSIDGKHLIHPDWWGLWITSENRQWGRQPTFHGLWKLSFRPPVTENPRYTLGPSFLTSGVHFICKVQKFYSEFECFLHFPSTLFFLSAVAVRVCFAVTLLTGLGTAYNFPCDLEQFYSFFFAQHLHDIHGDKSHRWQTMLKVLECDMEWDNRPLS